MHKKLIVKDVKKNIGFAIRGIVTRQFALIKESYYANEAVEVSNELGFGFDKENGIVAVFFNTKFECNNAPFVILEIGCEFNIESNSIQDLLNESKSSIHLPIAFAKHIAMLTIGTARGIMHEKLTQTDFKQFVLPSVNLNDLVMEDVVIEL